MAVRSSGGWAFAPARPHQREGRSHPFCISPLLCLINWVPNTPVEYIMCPPHLQTPLPPIPPPHHLSRPSSFTIDTPPHPHLLPNLIALLLLFPPPTPPPSLCLTSISHPLLISDPLSFSFLSTSLRLCVRWQSPKHISIHLAFQAVKEGGAWGGGKKKEEIWKTI